MSGPWTLAHGPGGALRTYTTPHTVTDPRRSAVVICPDLPVGRAGSFDVGRPYLMLADRLAVESGRRVVTGTLSGTGGSEGDFSAGRWLDDLGFLVDLSSSPGSEGVWLAGFGIGGPLCLRHAVCDRRVKGVACLGAPADLLAGAAAPEALFERCRAVGVIRSCDHPEDVKAWAQELSDLSPLDAASALRPRPLLVMHGADDQEVPIAAARSLAEAAAPYSDLRLVFGAGHWLRADPRVVATLMGWLERQR